MGKDGENSSCQGLMVDENRAPSAHMKLDATECPLWATRVRFLKYTIAFHRTQ